MNYKEWCWRCGKLTNEWLSFKWFITNKGKCFNCRIDALDEKYGPSEIAKIWRDINIRGAPKGMYIPAYPNLWGLKLYKVAIRNLIK